MESWVDFAGGQRIQVARSIDCGSIWVSRVNLRTRDLTNRREPAHALQLSLSLSLCLQRRRRLSACRTFLHFQELPLVNRDTL